MKIRNKIVDPQQETWKIEQKKNALKSGNAAARRGAAADKAAQIDRVDVSIAREINSEAAARAEKVARLAQLVRDGRYKPDLNKVAEAFVEVVDEEVDFARLANDES